MGLGAESAHPVTLPDISEDVKWMAKVGIARVFGVRALNPKIVVTRDEALLMLYLAAEVLNE